MYKVKPLGNKLILPERLVSILRGSIFSRRYFFVLVFLALLIMSVSSASATNMTKVQIVAGTAVSPSAVTLIHDIQGSGVASPVVDQSVTIEGIVVGDYQGSSPQLGGFYLQEEDADADADSATSEGIFIYSNASVERGDLVQVIGIVNEYYNLTEIKNVTSVQIVSSGNPLPSPTLITLPSANLADLERYEGMLVTFSQALTVTDVYSLGRYGQVDLAANGRLRAPTSIVAPGAPAIALADLNRRSRIILDDAQTNQNPDPEAYPSPGLSANNTLRVGYTVENLTGIWDERHGAYRVQPIGPVDFVATNPRPPSPADVGGNLRVAGFNMLNYFVTLGAGNNCGPNGGLECRGATNAAEFTRQRDKLISAITSINPDVVGLMEMENDTGDGAVADLESGLNAVAGAGTYAHIETGAIGTDAIRQAIIYKPSVVTPVGSYRILTSAVNPLFLDTKNRPSLAQTFALNSNGGRLTVVVNHFKSKRSDCVDVGDPDAGDGQGNCNVTRTNAVKALTQWLAADPTGSGDADYLILGDMNAYAQEDPIAEFTKAGFVDLISKFLGSTGYSYVFNGESGYLDHAAASPSLATQVTGVTEWHINVDEPVALDYNTENKDAAQQVSYYSPGPFRSSDHDPVVVGINLEPTQLVPAQTSLTLSSSKNPLLVGEQVTVTATLAQHEGAPVSEPTLMIPTGTVTFTIDGKTNITRTMSGNSIAAYRTLGLTVGTHIIAAEYSGDSSLAPSAAMPLAQVVNPRNLFFPLVDRH